MAQNGTNRKNVILDLLPSHSQSLLDIGCGVLSEDYPYLDSADHIVAADWNLRIVEPLPDKIETVEGDFMTVDFGGRVFDTIVLADVFEHVPIEAEREFADRCIELLKPGGDLVISVPHAGTFALLDPYRVKPFVHRQLWRLGLYKHTHNGDCDIRKGHKHYRLEELSEAFSPLAVDESRRWGYFFDPLDSWLSSIVARTKWFPGYKTVERRCAVEGERDYADKAFNVALRLTKPASEAS